VWSPRPSFISSTSLQAHFPNQSTRLINKRRSAIPRYWSTIISNVFWFMAHLFRSSTGKVGWFENIKATAHHGHESRYTNGFLSSQPLFLQKQFTNQGGCKYSIGPHLRMEHCFACDLGRPDIAGDLGQPAPCCHCSIKLAGARRSWNGYSRQESEAKVIRTIFS